MSDIKLRIKNTIKVIDSRFNENAKKAKIKVSSKMPDTSLAFFL